MMHAVHRYEGYVAKPWAMASLHSLARPLPMRIILSAPSMRHCACRKRSDSMRTLRREHGVNLEIRVGVNTGEVVCAQSAPTTCTPTMCPSGIRPV